jgi:hypothetical protein
MKSRWLSRKQRRRIFMKKALVVLLALTCLSALAFADDVAWTFGATVKTGAQITIPSTGSTMIQAYDVDDPAASRVRLDAEAALGDFSAHVRVGGDLAGATTSAGVFLNAWWVNSYFLDKMIQLQFGVLDHSVTDTVNKGWGGITVTGAQVVVTPMSGLSIGVAVPVSVTPGTIDSAFAGTRLGFAYTMPNLVTLKATFMNGAGDKNDSFAAGVAVLAVPNLTAQLEAQLVALGNQVAPIKTTPATVYGFNEIFANVEYALGGLKPGVEVDVTMYGNSGPSMTFGVKPKVAYTVMTGTDVGVSVAYTSKALTTAAGGYTQADSLVADPWVAFAFNTKAALKIDAAYTIPDLTATGTWSLPININFKYSF